MPRDRAEETAAAVLEAALARSEERLAAAMSVGRLGLWEWDLDTDLVDFRVGYASVFGSEAGRFKGPFAHFLEFLHPADRPLLSATLAEARSTHGTVSCELRVLFPDGHAEWRQATGRFSYDAAGRPLRAHAVLRDINATKVTEDKLAASREQLRALASRLEAVREDERTRIAREIHDELGQALTAAKLEVAWLERHLDDPGAAGRLRERTRATGALLDATMQSVRRIATELRPPVLDDLGLVSAAEWLVDDLRGRSGLVVALEVASGVVEPSPATATATFRILQELLTNVVRHAEATRIEVALARDGDDLLLTVRDDGRGIAPAQRSGGHALGILGMRERAAAVGGTLVIDAVPAGGTVVVARLPLVSPHPGQAERP
jgi:two-component system sensor histidine kinase UhpB